ncbi:helix-turn-helix transcriptional regulator [Streptomyces noursei]|uniref:helix-turn-helix domain-containing protein n=1 Tax=Streptomyces noursei TaxID=1971 RepID=UPI00081C8F84|nr:DNA binding protein [Streptomyces noursei ATCC 11455]MCZ0994373.1 helix-turn-helix transcriptional regulator [Streptomyces noursei]
MNEPSGWKRLAVAIRRERERQGLSQAELAERAGVSVGSVKNAESGTAPKRRKPYTLTHIESALGWQPGTVDDFLRGEVITPAPELPRVRTTGDAMQAGQALRALAGAMEFSRVCEELGAPPEVVVEFEAAAEALLAATVSARKAKDRLTQEHFAAVAHSPGGEGGPESDRAIVDEVVRSFDEEQAKK